MRPRGRQGSYHSEPCRLQVWSSFCVKEHFGETLTEELCDMICISKESLSRVWEDPCS
jgi:hypothetical protein